MASLADQARQITEYRRRSEEEAISEQEHKFAQLRLTDEWRAEQTRLGNEVLEFIPKQVERRADDGHMFAWVMDITPEQFTVREMPIVTEYNDHAIQKKLFGAARIAAEYLRKEKLRVFVRHKGCMNGVHRHEMIANWAQREGT